MKLKKRSLALLVSLSLGLASAIVTYLYLQDLSKQAVPATAVPKLVRVVVAREDIPSKTSLTAEMVAYAEIPEEAVLPGSIRNMEDVIGAVTKSPLLAGEVLNQNRLWEKGVTPGLTFQIPPGKRAITIGVNEVIGVAGFVKPGDYVDVLATMENERGQDVTNTILQHVQVLAIAQETEDKEGGKPKVATTLTLAVTLDEAARLTLAEERGVLRIVLRPAEQHDRLRTAPVTIEDVLNAYNPAPVRQVVDPEPVAPKVIIRRLPQEPPAPVIRQVEVIRGTVKEIVQVVK
ncbi:MAG: Flp pilus assembly protein CpaB [Firmicutes bacterium]|nr:Flp pilus assembly protein CpaB [Bacillota bacterium]